MCLETIADLVATFRLLGVIAPSRTYQRLPLDRDDSHLRNLRSIRVSAAVDRGMWDTFSEDERRGRFKVPKDTNWSAFSSSYGVGVERITPILEIEVEEDKYRRWSVFPRELE